MAFDLSTWATAKYRFSFTDDSGAAAVCEIHEDGFSGTTNDATGTGRNSVSTTYDIDGENEYGALMASTTSVSFYDDFTSDSIATDLIDSINTIEDKYLVVIRHGNTLKWVGNVDPEGVDYDEQGPVPLTIVAVDGLGRLDNKPYITNTDGTSVDAGATTFTAALAGILSSTGFGLDIYISSSLYHKTGTLLTSADNPLDNTWFNKLALTTKKDDDSQGVVSKLSALKAICEAWLLQVKQWNGAWYLIQVNHNHATGYRQWRYDSSGSAVGSPNYSDVDPRVNLTNEALDGARSRASVMKGYNSSIVQYQHGPIQILRYPRFEVQTIAEAEAYFGGDYAWSRTAQADFFVFDDGSWGMGVDNLDAVAANYTGYSELKVNDLQAKVANASGTGAGTLDSAIGSAYLSTQRSQQELQSGDNIIFTAQAYLKSSGSGSNPADWWNQIPTYVAFQVKHYGSSTQYLEWGSDGSLDWTTTPNWLLLKNQANIDGWLNIALSEIESIPSDGDIEVSLGPSIIKSGFGFTADLLVWDNVQIVPVLADGTVNNDATSTLNFIDRSSPRPVKRAVVFGDGPSSYNKGSMFSDSSLSTITQDWEESTGGHSGTDTNVDHATLIGKAMLTSMNKVRLLKSGGYPGHGDILGPLDVLNLSAGLHVPKSITINWIKAYTTGSWYLADESVFSNDLETGVSTGAHLLSDFGRGSSGAEGFNFNRIGSSFDALLARESDRLATVSAAATSGTTVSCTALAEDLNAGDPVFFQNKETGYVMKRVVAADAAATDTSFTVTSAFTASEALTVGDPILPGSISGLRIDMDGVQIVNTHLKNDGIDAFNGTIQADGTVNAGDEGTLGWAITRAGIIIANELRARGKIVAGDVYIGKDVGDLDYTVGPYAGTAGEHGIWINPDNYWIIDTNAAPDKTHFRVGDSTAYMEWDETAPALKVVSGGSTVFDSSTATSGIGLDGTIDLNATGIIQTAGYPDGVYIDRNKVELTSGGTVSKLQSGILSILNSGSSHGITVTGGSGTITVETSGSTSSITGTGITPGGGVNYTIGPAAGAGNLTLQVATGNIIIDGSTWPTDTPNDGDILTWNTGGTLSWDAIPSGVTTFVGLSDTPANYTSAANRFVKVNGAANALEFVADPGYITGVSNLTDIGDVSGTPADKHVIYYDGVGGGWVSETLASALGDQNVSSLINDAGYTTNTGTVTEVISGLGTGIDVATSTTTPTLTLNLDELGAGTIAEFAGVSAGGGTIKQAIGSIEVGSFANSVGYTTNAGTVTSVISGAGSGIDVTLATTTPTLVLNLNELSAGTIASFAGVSAGGDSIVQAIANINVGDFNNDAGYTSNAGTVTSVISGAGSGIDVSLATTTPTLVINLSELGGGTIASFAGVSAGGSSVTQAIGGISLSSFNDDLSYASAGDNISIFTNDSGYTTNTGTVTSVISGAGSGIDVSLATTTPTLVLDLSELGSGTIASFSGVSAGGSSINQSIGSINVGAFNDDGTYLDAASGVTGTFNDTEFQTVDGGAQTEYRQRTVTVTNGQITAFGTFGAWQTVVVA